MRFLRIIEILALALWIGSLAGFAFVFAPVVFSRLNDHLDTFASIVAGTLGQLTLLGYICGALSLAASVAAAALGERRAAIVRIICVVLALALTTYDQRAIVPAMTQTQAAFHQPFNAVPKTDPLRVRYDALHAQSSRVYGAALIFGIVALASLAL